ncbi:MAG: hypothetical protein P8103_03135 [Candidatus Thiodiazotropha sp.]
MSLKKHGVIVDCEHCIYTNNDGRSCFDITVPISDSETGASGQASLHCSVTAEQHIIELTKWQDADHHLIQITEKLKNRVSSALNYVADHRICGNRKLCPSEVVRVVEEYSAK